MFGYPAMALSFFLFTTPLSAVNEARDSGDLGQIALLPFVAMCLNNFLWLAYGSATMEPKVTATALFGLVMGLYYLTIYYALKLDKESVWNYVYIAMLFVLGTVWSMYHLISPETAPEYLGAIASGTEILMYGAPAAEMPHVCRTGDIASMPLGVSLATFLCSFLWSIYGFEIMDDFLIIASVAGTVLAALQLVTIGRFYKWNDGYTAVQQETQDSVLDLDSDLDLDLGLEDAKEHAQSAELFKDGQADAFRELEHLHTI